jgi:hypothetical protein
VVFNFFGGMECKELGSPVQAGRPVVPYIQWGRGLAAEETGCPSEETKRGGKKKRRATNMRALQ